MKKVILLTVACLLTSLSLFAQDYFSDRKGDGTPIILSNNKDRLLFTAAVDVSDKSSLKANIFKQYWVNEKSYKPLADPRHKSMLGWGASVKASTTNGTSSLFGSGDLSPAFSGGIYGAYTNLNWHKNDDSLTVFSSWALILSGNLNYAHQQFFDPSQAYASQLSSSTFHGSAVALSYVLKLHPVKDKSNLFIGASFTYSHKSNFDDLTSVQIKNDSLITGSGTTRTVTQTNKDGDIYAQGKFKEYNNSNFRLNATYIPGMLNYKVGFTLYPSVDLSSLYTAKYNLGLAFSLLKDKSPSMPVASLFFELADINNATASTKPFLKRAFKVGVSTTLNVLTGGK
jgi:hypothetical protein